MTLYTPTWGVLLENAQIEAEKMKMDVATHIQNLLLSQIIAELVNAYPPKHRAQITRDFQHGVIPGSNHDYKD